MNLFGWHLTFPERFRRRRQPRPPVRPGLRCAACGGGIHKRDKYVILTARHRDCKDPKLAGAQMFPLEFSAAPQDSYRLPGIDGAGSEHLRFVGPNQEPVIMPPHSVMGAEIIDPNFRNRSRVHSPQLSAKSCD